MALCAAELGIEQSITQEIVINAIMDVTRKVAGCRDAECANCEEARQAMACSAEAKPKQSVNEHAFTEERFARWGTRLQIRISENHC